MSRVRDLLAEVRGQPAPTGFYPRPGGAVVTREIRRVAVLGAGSWGTTFAKVLADAGREVRLWARRAEVAAAINDSHANPDYLPGVAAAGAARRDHRRARAALDGADAVVLAVPSQTLRANLSRLAGAAARRERCWSAWPRGWSWARCPG